MSKMTYQERKRANSRAKSLQVYAELCAADKILGSVRGTHERYRTEPEYVKMMRGLALMDRLDRLLSAWDERLVG